MSNYGPKKMKLYDSTNNIERKMNNTGDVVGEGPNHNSKPGQLSAKQEATKLHAKSRVKALSGPVVKPVLTNEEKVRYAANMKKDEMLEVESDGKQEMVEGKEPLKKDPRKRWNSLKKALHHDKAFMNLDEELEPDKEEEQPQEAGQEPQPEEADMNAQPQQQPEESEGEAQGEQAEPEAVSQGEDAPQEEGQENEQQPDPQELAEALKEEGYSDQEIAYIVHGQHSAEVDPTKQAKAKATTAMSDLDLDNASQMSQMERDHALQSMEHERSHKQRMADLEYGDAQKQKGATDMEQSHKQRMLDLEYEKTKRESADQGDDGSMEADKQMKQLEVEKKKLELKLREQEMKLELEFKQKEHELKLKMMEQQLKEQHKQKSEISGIKHEQKLVDTKNPPKEKKPLKKFEEDDE